MNSTTPPASQESITKKKLKALWADSRSGTQRLTLAALVMAAACFTLIFFGPFENVAFGGNSMSYSYWEIWPILAGTAVAVWAVGTLLLCLLRGKVFNYAVSLVFAITLCGYLQAVFMNSSLGTLTGDAIDWHSKRGDMMRNLLIWIAVIFAVYFVLYLSRSVWKQLLAFVSALLLVMQGASTFSIFLSDTESGGSIRDYCLADSGMYEFSSEDNIFVFVLDRLDYVNIQSILAKDPDFFDGMDGFTCYTNAVSAYARTQPALTHLLTGSETAFSVPSQDYYADAWNEDGKHLLEDLKKQGYSVELYSNIRYLFSDPAYATGYVDNAVRTNSLKTGAVLSKLMHLSMYRHAPLMLKPFYWTDTNFYNDGVFQESSTTAYQFQDTYYMARFPRSIATRQQNSFKLYHFYGSHAPYTMTSEGYLSEEPTTAWEQTMGCFKHLFAAFARMKELGIYEDATILITADHGNAYSDTKPVSRATQIGLFYKPSGSSGTPLAMSSAPVCTDNIPATLAKAAGISNYAPYGQALEDISQGADITRYYYKTIAGNWEHTVYKYAITGDASVFENWEIIEIIEDIPEENSFY